MLIPECPFRPARCLVTDFITPDNVAIKEQAHILLALSHSKDDYIKRCANFVRDNFKYPLDYLGNPSAGLSFKRHDQGRWWKYFYNQTMDYAWGFPNETQKLKLGICLTPDTPILCLNHTGTAYKPIAEIKVGDKVLSHTGKWRKITELFERVVSEDLVHLHLNNSEIIRITGNHPIYTTRGWVPAGELTLNDIVYKIKDVVQDGFFKNLSGSNNPNWHGGKKPTSKTTHISKHPLHSCLICNTLTKNKKYCSHRCCSQSQQNKPHSPEVLARLSEIHKQNHADPNSGYNTPTGKANHHRFPRGFNYPKNGELNPNWRGGISFEPYGLEFNKELKQKIRNRDNNVCINCGRIGDEITLDTHHIDYNKQHNYEQNLITLCKNCHCKTNGCREYWTGYFKSKIESLYDIVISNGTCILKIERQFYSGNVYNLEVEIDHSYVGKGIIYHNCIDTSLLMTSLLIAGDVPAVCALGEVVRASDNSVTGYHAWPEFDYKGKPQAGETTVHFEADTIIGQNSLYEPDSDWAKNNDLFYRKQSGIGNGFYEATGNLSSEMVKLMGLPPLPAEMVQSYGLQETLEHMEKKRKALAREWRKSEVLKTKILFLAFGGG